MEKEEVQALFARYNKNFQEKLCLIMLDDRVFCDRMIEILNVQHLELKYLQVFTQKIFDHKNQYKTHPSREIMENILRTDLDDCTDVLKKQIREYYVRMKTSSFETEKEYIKDEALDFCRRQKLQEAMLSAAKQIKNSRFDQVSKIINDALKLGSDNDVGYDYIKDFEKRYVDNVRHPIPTGWEIIDNITAGGMGRKEFGVIIGATGQGKSQALVCLAANALRQGKTVVYYTLELQAEVVALRTDANLTGIAKDELRHSKEEILELIKQMPGRYIIKHFPKKSVSIHALRNHIEKLIGQGIQPDLVLVDYLELLKPSTNKTESRHETEDQFAEFEAMCQEYNFAGWTVSQTNRRGINAEIVTMEEVSEYFAKCFGAYIIITLSRDLYDKANNTGKFFIAKNRSGNDGLIYDIFIDTARSEIKVLGLRKTEDEDEGRAKYRTELQQKLYQDFKQMKDVK